MEPFSFGEAVKAVQSWYAEHARLPTPQEWEKAAPGRPSRRTIRRRWGWDQLMEEASGVRLSQHKDDEQGTRDRELLSALIAARDELGRWPGAREWERASADHAGRRTYVRHFGSWELARHAASRLRISKP